MGVSIGIDLGTTFSAVAVIDKVSNTPKIVLNKEGEKITPSVIQFQKNYKSGEVTTIVGSEAKEAFELGEDGCVSAFKRLMGTDKEYYKFDGRSYTSVDLSAILLKYLKEGAEIALGEEIKDAVITVPAYFYSAEREATIRAAQMAGIKVKKIIDEPNAAAMAFGLNHWRDNANILVYDLGGGTFDVTLIHMENGGMLRTIVTRGDHILGGKDWDARILGIVKNKIFEDTSFEVDSDPDFSKEVMGLAETLKKKLTQSDVASVNVNVPDFGSYVVKINLKEFESGTTDLLNKTGSLCESILKEAGLNWNDVTDILLVGGSTRMRQVSKYLEKISGGHKPLSQVNPDEAVALGAAIQSSKEKDKYATLSVQVIDGKKVTDRSKVGLSLDEPVKQEKKLANLGLLSLSETTAHAMGIIAINDEGNRYYNEIIIPANHPRPVRAAKKFRFYTSASSNNELAIFVLQGDNYNPADCQITSKYIVTGIQHVKYGEKLGTIMRIQYSYDENGVIHVQARQEQSNRDLPIRRESVTEDISHFGKPISSANENQGFNMGVQLNSAPAQGLVHKYKAITFSNVEWEKYDNVSYHDNASEFNFIEPKIHVIANEKKIEFHGYNVSRMDEGVLYTINSTDDFEIECDIDTSTISPHPGGYLEISLGIISARLDQNGGNILLNGKSVSSVGSKFHIKMSLTEGGRYEVDINRNKGGEQFQPTMGGIDVKFGFVHEGHCCSLLSHAYVSDISMMQRAGKMSDDNPDVDTWDD